MEREPGCRFREEDNICAIKRQADPTPSKPICQSPAETTETCATAISWQQTERTANPIDLGLVPPMGEID